MTASAASAAEPDLLADVFAGNPPHRASVGDLRKAISEAHAIFVGEQHDDPLTHRAELSLLEAAHRACGAKLTLAMEMFERDQQPALSDYLAGRITEDEMAKRVKLWPNYRTDYRPLVEYAKANRIPVIASNAPAGVVRQVGREGLAALAKLSADDRKHVAAYVNAPDGDEYARRFAAIIGQGHGDGKGMDPAMVRRFYEAQCLRDDTMAESVARAMEVRQGIVPTVLHVNGSFHSDGGLGTVQRLRWRRPLEIGIVVVKIVPYTGEAVSLPGKALDERGEADYLVFVRDTRPPDKDDKEK